MNEKQDHLRLVSVEEDSPAYSSVPTNKPRHIVFCDEAITILIRSFRMTHFEVNTPLTGHGGLVSADGVDPSSEAPVHYEGSGPTVGHALRALLDAVAEDYPPDLVS